MLLDERQDQCNTLGWIGLAEMENDRHRPDGCRRECLKLSFLINIKSSRPDRDQVV